MDSHEAGNRIQNFLVKRCLGDWKNKLTARQWWQQSTRSYNEYFICAHWRPTGTFFATFSNISATRPKNDSSPLLRLSRITWQTKWLIFHFKDEFFLKIERFLPRIIVGTIENIFFCWTDCAGVTFGRDIRKWHFCLTFYNKLWRIFTVGWGAIVNLTEKTRSGDKNYGWLESAARVLDKLNSFLHCQTWEK